MYRLHRFHLPAAGRLAVRLTAILVLMLARGSFSEPVFSSDSTPGKRPKTVIPVHYAIELKPDLKQLTSAGSEIVDIEVRQATAQLTLNALNMTLDTAEIDDGAQRAAITLDAATETAMLTFSQPLTVGAHR